MTKFIDFDPTKPYCPGCNCPISTEIVKLRLRYEKGKLPDPRLAGTMKTYQCRQCRALVSVFVIDGQSPDERYSVMRTDSQN